MILSSSQEQVNYTAWEGGEGTMHILIVISKGKVEDVMCCADGNDRSHLLTLGTDYCVLDLDEIEKLEWIEPELYSSSEKKGKSTR